MQILTPLLLEPLNVNNSVNAIKSVNTNKKGKSNDLPFFCEEISKSGCFGLYLSSLGLGLASCTHLAIRQASRSGRAMSVIGMMPVNGHL